MTDEEIDTIFLSHKVVPDVVPAPPKQFLSVSYAGGTKVDKGGELTPTQVKTAPTVSWDASDNTFYTIILTDPDAPSRKNPTNREYQHWVVANIPGNNIEKGEVITAYVGSGPPEGTGLHRYVFLLYKQPMKMKFDEERIAKNSGRGRARFSAAKFAKKHKMTELVAGNFFQAQWDDYVPTVHKQLKG
uniref:Phosphatidylethanolamine-binding protein n=1 Tax=Glossina pallidipes TaxID=7398 RepID=A0A1B0AAF5_GLOPL